MSVVIDANVLYPLTLRDTVLRAAAAGFYQLRWSKDILDEMERNLVAKGKISTDKAARLRATMETYFPEAGPPCRYPPRSPLLPLPSGCHDAYRPSAARPSGGTVSGRDTP